jgi:hypothetical protein
MRRLPTRDKVPLEIEPEGGESEKASRPRPAGSAHRVYTLPIIQSGSEAPIWVEPKDAASLTHPLKRSRHRKADSYRTC